MNELHLCTDPIFSSLSTTFKDAKNNKKNKEMSEKEALEESKRKFRERRAAINSLKGIPRHQREAFFNSNFKSDPVQATRESKVVPEAKKVNSKVADPPVIKQAVKEIQPEVNKRAGSSEVTNAVNSQIENKHIDSKDVNDVTERRILSSAESQPPISTENSISNENIPTSDSNTQFEGVPSKLVEDESPKEAQNEDIASANLLDENMEKQTEVQIVSQVTTETEINERVRDTAETLLAAEVNAQSQEGGHIIVEEPENLILEMPIENIIVETEIDENTNHEETKLHVDSESL